MDLLRACQYVNHKLLIEKLEACGLNSSVL